MEMMSMENLAIGYGHHVVADGLTATLHAAELVALLGCNGTGKSTLLRTLAGFQPPLGGKLRVVSSKSPVAVVLTEQPAVGNLTVGEVVALGRSPFTGFWGVLSEADRRVVADALEAVGITQLEGRMMPTLSDGERQKVMVAKALAQQTPVMILDEPTAFLDYPSKREMMFLLRRMAMEWGKTVLLSTHDVELATACANRLWVLRRSSPHLLTGTVDELNLEEEFKASTPLPKRGE